MPGANSNGSVEVMLRTEGDVDRRGRGLDREEHALQRWSGSKELPPDVCLEGHIGPPYRQGWEPGKGRTYECTAEGCSSVQYRR